MRSVIYTISIILMGLSSLAQSQGGTLSSNTVVCSGINNGLLSVNGYSGSITRWEYAMGNSGPWTPMIFTSNTYNYINLTQTTYFRVIVQLPGYSEAASNVVSVSCDNLSIGGIINTTTFQCVNTPLTSTLSANNGSVVLWEYSLNNWMTTNTITTTNTLNATLASLTSTTNIRVQVKNGVCPAVYSNTVTVFPANNSVGGNISGSQSVCAISNSSTLSLNNYTGAIQYWESAGSIGGPFNLIASTASSISFSNLSQNTWYRAQVKNANCASAASALFVVNVDQASAGGSIVGTSPVCAQLNTGALQLIANTGSVMNWQQSSNGGMSWNSISNTSSNLTFTNLVTSSVFRASVQNGICPSAFSNQFTITVNPLPNAVFTVAPACINSPLNFSTTGTGNNTYTWDFGDGSSSSIAQPNHTYLSPGTYTVKLSVTSSQNCTDSVKHPLVIYPKPSSSFISSDTACFGNSIQFTNASTIVSGSISQLTFNFGDGSPTSNLNSISHYFLSEGVYSVSLLANSNFGCKDSITKLISIYPKPDSQFLTSNVCKGSASIFSNQSLLSSGSLTHHWSFGNSANSNVLSPSYTYSLAGTYTVSLISTSNHNCRDTFFKAIRIHEKPSVVLLANNACMGTPVVFQQTLFPSHLSYFTQLNYGDGSPVATSLSSHSYTVPGVFISQLTLTTDSGCVSTASKYLSIYAKPSVNFVCQNSCKEDSVVFINSSSILNGTMTYTWNLSPTQLSYASSPTSIYTLAGQYSITLIAKSDLDCSDSLTKSLVIFESPKANFIFNDVCDGFPISFTNTSSFQGNGLISSSWAFGDNTISADINPVKEYLSHGIYTVALIVSSTEGCTDSIKKKLNIFEGPVADFRAVSVCKNSPTVFSNSSLLKSGNYTSHWQFGDSATSVLNSPSHQYKKEGLYSVTLKITSNSNCADSVTRHVECFPLPTVTALKDSSIEKGFGFFLKAEGGLSYSWIPAFGLSDPTDSKPYCSPDSSMTYVVTGTDKNGCKNFDSLVVIVNDNFLVIPFNVLTPDFNGKNDTWIIKNIENYPENHVLIFDQWNQKIYETDGYTNEWDGKNLKGEILPDATYYYLLSFKNNSKIYSGYISLIRNSK